MKTYPKVIEVWEGDLINKENSYIRMNFYEDEIDKIFIKDYEDIDNEIQFMYEKKMYIEDTPYYKIEEWEKCKESFVYNRTFDFEFDENNELKKTVFSDAETKKIEEEFENEYPFPVLLYFDISKFYKKGILIE